MRFRRLGLLALVLAIGGTAGCSQKSAAEKAVRESLKDPDSAKFGDFYYNDKTKKGCLAVNAKNSMGGYTGEQQAYVEKTEGGWEAIAIADVSATSCRRIHAD